MRALTFDVTGCLRLRCASTSRTSRLVKIPMNVQGEKHDHRGTSAQHHLSLPWQPALHCRSRGCRRRLHPGVWFSPAHCRRRERRDYCRSRATPGVRSSSAWKRRRSTCPWAGHRPRSKPTASPTTKQPNCRVGITSCSLSAGRAAEHGLRSRTLGFDQGELAQMLNPGLKDGLCDPDELPAAPDQAITHPGDLWLLGEHWLLCGDSANAADVERLIDGQPIHLVVSDPPYNVNVEPRSNNAMAAGLSSLRRHLAQSRMKKAPRAQPADRQETAGQGSGLCPTISFPKGSSIACSTPDLATWPGSVAWSFLLYLWGGYSNCGNYPPVWRGLRALLFSQASFGTSNVPF